MSLFPEVDELKSRLTGLRPLPESLSPLVDQNLLEEWSYHSLALESLDLDLPGVRLLLRHRLTPAGASFDELIRVERHAEAARYLLTTGRNEPHRWVTENLIREIHGLFVSGVLHIASYRQPREEDIWSDQPSERQNPSSGQIRGAPPAPDPLDIPERLSYLSREEGGKQGEKHSIEYAAGIYCGLVEIQPFTDENGPTARLALNLRLVLDGYPAISFGTWDRESYVTAMQAAFGSDLHPLIELIEREVLRSSRLELQALEDRQSLTPERVGLRFQGLDQHIELIEGTGRTVLSKSPRDRARAVRRVGAHALNLLKEVRKSARGDRFSVRETGSYREGLETDLMANLFRNLQESGISPRAPEWHHEAVLEFRPNQSAIIEADLYYCTFASPDALHVVVVASILKEPSEVTDEISEDTETKKPDLSRIEVLLHEDILTLPLNYPYEVSGKEHKAPIDLQNFVLSSCDLFLDRILEGYEFAASPALDGEPRSSQAKNKKEAAKKRGTRPSKFRPLAPPDSPQEKS